jgi:hypothetical protein
MQYFTVLRVGGHSRSASSASVVFSMLLWRWRQIATLVEKVLGWVVAVLSSTQSQNCAFLALKTCLSRPFPTLASISTIVNEAFSSC